MYIDNTLSCKDWFDRGGSLWKNQLTDLPAKTIAELFSATKPTSPDYFVTSIGETRYICYSTLIEDSYELKKKKNQAHQL